MRSAYVCACVHEYVGSTVDCVHDVFFKGWLNLEQLLLFIFNSNYQMYSFNNEGNTISNIMRQQLGGMSAAKQSPYNDMFIFQT